MLYFVVVLSLLSVACGQVDKRPVVHAPAILLNAAKEAAAACVKETGSTPEVAENFFNLKFDSDLNSKKFLYCLSRKVNYADEDGHLNDALLTVFEGHSLQGEVQKVLEKCNKFQEKTNIDTMFKTVECFYQNTPVLLVQ